MDRDIDAIRAPSDLAIDDVWRHDRDYVLGMASRMLGDPVEAEDVVQDAFDRLSHVELARIDDVRGWLAVVVRRLCLDRIKSAYNRREFVTSAVFPDALSPLHGHDADDPVDRVTLDDEVQLALAIVLDRLTPAERTAFVLHDVFGFPFEHVGQIVGRTPSACRQLASRARRSIGAEAPPAPPEVEVTQQRIVAERFIAACEGGDVNELMALLDPHVEGAAQPLGPGPIQRVTGAPAVADRLLALLGPGTGCTLLPLQLEDLSIVAYDNRHMAAVITLEAHEGRVHHIHGFFRSPARA